MSTMLKSIKQLILKQHTTLYILEATVRAMYTAIIFTNADDLDVLGRNI